MSRVTNTALAPDGTIPDLRYLLAGPTTRQGKLDPAGAWSEDVPAGGYDLTELTGSLIVKRKLYVPYLEGPFAVSQLLSPRAAAAVQVFGAPGTFHGIDARVATTTEQTFATKAMPFEWRPGKAIGWTALGDGGKLFMPGQEQRLNALLPTSQECSLTIFDPATGPTHILIPTTTGKLSLVGSNGGGTTGGAYGADIVTMTVAGEPWVIALQSVAFQGWRISENGLWPTLAVFRKVGGLWTYDAAKSMTGDDLHNSSVAGATAFPWTTNAFGEQYANTRAIDEIEVTPVSNVILAPQYFSNPALGWNAGGLVAIDPVTRTVLAQLDIQFQSDGVVSSLNPRDLFVDPTGTLGGEVFGVIYDTFAVAGGSCDFSYCQFFRYDHPNARIVALSNAFRCDSGDTRWTKGMFDANGWAWLATLKTAGSVWQPWRVFPKVDGSWKFANYPHKFNNTYGDICDADFTVSQPTGETSYAQSRPQWDPVTSTALFCQVSIDLAAIKAEGDAHAPRLTRLPTVRTDYNTYIGNALVGARWPAEPSLDVVHRTLWWPQPQFESVGTNPSYPGFTAPYELEQHLIAFDVDRCAATPVFVGSSSAGVALATSLTIPLPLNGSPARAPWVAGDLALAFITSGLTTSDAATTLPAGWTLVDEQRNGTAGNGYMLAKRILQAGDADPQFTFPRAVTATGCIVVYRHADPAAPINAFLTTMNANNGSDTVLQRGGVTPSVVGCRIVGFYGAAGVQGGWTVGAGDVTPGELRRVQQLGVLGGGGSVLATEEEQLSTSASVPTRSRMVTDTVAGLHGCMTVAIAPRPAPAAPPAVASVVLSPSTVNGGSTSTATVTLASTAIADTTVVMRVSGAGARSADVQYTLLIPAGQISGTVTIQTSNPDALTTVNVIGHTVDPSVGAVLTINSVNPLISDLITYATVAVPHCPKGTNDLHARVFYPSSGGPYPIVYVFNGAGFAHTFGADDDTESVWHVCVQLAQRGFVVMAVEYHGYNCGMLATDTMPGGGPGSWGTVGDAQTELCGRAGLAWMRAHAGTYGGDTTKEVTFGLSAGGHQAHMLALVDGSIDVAIGHSSLPSAAELVTSPDAYAHYSSYVGTSVLTADAYHFADVYYRLGLLGLGAGAPVQVMYNNSAELIPSGCMTAFGTRCASQGVPYRTTLCLGTSHPISGNHVLVAGDTRAGNFVYPDPVLGVDKIQDDEFEVVDTVF